LLAARKDSRRVRFAAAIVVASGLVAGAASYPAPSGGQRSHSPPRVIQLSYGETPGQSGPDRVLEAFARHTDSLRFGTFYNGHRASAPGKYRPDITDTDLHGRRAKHPWVPDRDRGGRRLVRLVHRSLRHRGRAKIRIHARSGDLVDFVRVRINLSKCTSDPPLYPVSCEIHVPHGPTLASRSR
jgi:hypothetical protein